MRLSSICTTALLAVQAVASPLTHKVSGFTIMEHPDPLKRALLQEYVTWDEKSLFINGERIMIFAAEIHPWRLPVPSLWKDILHKVKAAGFNTISFYVDWNLLEGKPGEYRAEGSFAWEPFFDAAAELGIYLIARPGPYINAEASGGGFPGWLQRINGTIRTDDKAYLDATENYVSHIGAVIADYQITNGGPIILYQPDNEYSGGCCGAEFPNPDYFQYVIDQARRAGVVVPTISNDAYPGGHNAPGTGKGEVDIYGHDNYPIGFDCSNPDVWPEGNLPTNYRDQHLQMSPLTPYTLVEYQAGAFDPWGGPGFENCAALVGHEFERVFYKNTISFGVGILGLYMTFGGTNWGNLGHPGGYTSYDYGSPIAETREITREKYSELKLIANFVKASPGYLEATPGNLTNTTYTNTADLTVTPLLGNDTGSFFVLRHSDYSSQASTPYKLRLPTSVGNLTIPQLDGSLTLNGRDSKVHVVDYDVAGTKILYSTAEVFTWKEFHDGKVLVVYGGPNEHHELAVSAKGEVKVLEGSKSSISSKRVRDAVVVAWDVEPTRRIVQIGDLKVLLLDRNSAYNYWVPQLGTESSIPYSTEETVAASIIVKAGYLVRTAFVKGHDLHLTADFNATTPIGVIGAPKSATSLFINGKQAKYSVDKNGIWKTEVEYSPPEISLPSLEDLDWKYLDTLPEAQPDYDDSDWPDADLPTKNTIYPLKTPTSLYAGDYGFQTGYLLFRGHFTANGEESDFFIQTQGGQAFGSSVWLDDEYLGSWTGDNAYPDNNGTYTLPSLESGQDYVFTVVVDNMGLNENWVIGQDEMKNPRGILNYRLAGHDASDLIWKITGNLGGEDYIDKSRGPLNEGGLYAERHGFHQPYPPSNTKGWKSSSPLDGLSSAGVAFYTASFDLDIESGWDVPIFFNIANSTTPAPAYRVQLYVNGWQYGKYVNTIGPQTAFPVPEGILNYRGTNWIAVTLWAQEKNGAKLDSFELSHGTPVKTTLDVELAEQPRFKARKGVY
ncbi:glycoside hydrolase family 35 protein [Aspergillus stella-maris]|uniref:glycoside hydrolase family 35 protein n=1 Tax=Aspergillus stella-maris TaxID=1810926 RepID=UPI003CCDB131